VGDWKHKLKADPTGWLLELESPPVRYLTLVDILNRPPDDLEVLEAQAAIPTYPPVAELLAAQERDGYWVKRDYYLPRASLGTFWVLTVLGDLGLTAEEEHVRRACNFMFTNQRENGTFCRHRRIPGEGTVWEKHTEPCTQARIVRFLIQFGYAEDPRVREAIDWLLPIQRDDGMWFCRGSRPPDCCSAGNQPGSYCSLRSFDGAAYEPLSRRRRVGDVGVPQVPVLWFQRHQRARCPGATRLYA
jgi:hypothetical protein